jgi:hypothetical protein
MQIMELISRRRDFEQQTRIYACEHCGTDNAITMTNAEWKKIGVF